MKLKFVTGNPGKVISPQRELAKFGIELEQMDLCSIQEIQADSAADVAVYKAYQAFRFSRPVAVMANDSAFHIDGLNGFPGPYVKPVTNAIGLEGFLRLMSPWSDMEGRRCRFSDAWALLAQGFASAVPAQTVFTREVAGRLATEIRGQDKPGQKSVLWKLFVPDGWDKTLAEMTEEELAAHRADFSNVYAEIAAWLWQMKGNGRINGAGE